MISVQNLHDNAAIGNDIGILQDIHLKSKNIAIYHRRVELLKERLAQAAELPLKYQASGTVKEIIDSLRVYFDNELSEYFDLMEDILILLKLFAKVTKASSFRVSLAMVSTTMCPRFHADNNQLRMLCTYQGPATLWLPDVAVDRRAYLTGKGNRSISLDESLIQQVDTGDVVILKGALYPGATPILHCSPNVEENADKRILLSIDTNQSLNL